MAPPLTVNQCLVGDALEQLRTLPDESVHVACCSPPFYGLRDYGHPDQLGLEDTPGDYVERLVGIFRELRRVLRPEGTLWLELGDSYAGAGKTGGVDTSSLVEGYDNGGTRDPLVSHVPTRPASEDGLKKKDLIGIPWRVALGLQADGWWLRQDVIWSKPSCMPSSVRDRCTTSHSYIFMLSRQARYFYDAEAIKEPAQDGGTRDRSRWKANGGRNRRSVWSCPTTPYPEAHFAVWPVRLVSLMIMAGSSEYGCCASCGAPWTRASGWEPSCGCGSSERIPCVVLDPFMGSGTTAEAAQALGRDWVGIELNPDYLELQRKRTAQLSLLRAGEVRP